MNQTKSALRDPDAEDDVMDDYRYDDAHNWRSAPLPSERIL